MKPIRKAVFPVAGMGTRFIPATKANPKEMLPVVDKPLIQYAAEEAIAAGCDELIFVTGRTKNAIMDHFDKAYELESELEKAGKMRLLDQVRNIIPAHVTTAYTRQNQALGLGHAVLCAKNLVGNEPFAVILADDMVMTKPNSDNCLSQMVKLYQKHQCSIIGVEQIDPQMSDKYGVIDSEKKLDGAHLLSGIVEKPAPKDAPSDLSVVGRYILTPQIFELLETTTTGAGGEIQLTDAIAKLLHTEPVLACQFTGKRFDCGDKLGYLQATVEYGLQHLDLKTEFAAYLRQIFK